MHYVHAKTLLSAQNGMNLYRGCTHGCIYCDSRSVCYHIDHAFEDIEVKQNALVLLEDALRRKRKKCMIGTGSMSDCYLPLEMELGYTRRALQLLYDYGFGVAVQTKSDRILRDLELLKKINERAKAVVQMTLTTWDDGLCRILEPNVCPTSARLEALRAFQQAGVPTVVWLCPILPFLNDTAENLSGILQGCAEAGVKGIVYFGAGVTLREGSREYFYAQLDRHFPGLKERYIRTYGDAYELLSSADRELSPLFHAFCEEHGMLHRPEAVFRFLHTLREEAPAGEQMSLLDGLG